MPQIVQQPGDIVEVRARRWLVENVDALEGGRPLAVVHLSCIDDDAQGEQLCVIWDAEIGARLVDDNPWDAIGRDGTDDAAVFAAFLRTLKWRTATAAEKRLFQAPFRAGIRLDAYQLAPLDKALALPRVNLLIADDVGLGKLFNRCRIGRRAAGQRAAILITASNNLASHCTYNALNLTEIPREKTISH